MQRIHTCYNGPCSLACEVTPQRIHTGNKCPALLRLKRHAKNSHRQQVSCSFASKETCKELTQATSVLLFCVQSHTAKNSHSQQVSCSFASKVTCKEFNRLQWALLCSSKSGMQRIHTCYNGPCSLACEVTPQRIDTANKYPAL